MANKGTYFNSITGSEAGKKGGKISKRPSFDQRMKAWMDTTLQELENPKINELADRLGVRKESTIEDLMRFSLLLNGLSGNTQAIREALTRTYGKTKGGNEMDEDGEKREPKEFNIIIDSGNVEEVPMIDSGGPGEEEDTGE